MIATGYSGNREVAATCGATVVETQEALAAASTGGILGHELILEHLHPNIEGYLRIADAYYEALRSAGAIGEWRTPVPLEHARRELLVTAFDSLVGSLNVRVLANRWPFQPPGVVKPDTFRVTTLVDSLGLEYLRGRQTWADAVAKLGIRYEEQGDYASALRASLALAQQQPYRARPYILAGNLLLKMQRPAAAYQAFVAAEEREPSVETRRALGRLLLTARRPVEAIPWLRGVVELDDADPAALYDLAVAYAAAGRFDLYVHHYVQPWDIAPGLLLVREAGGYISEMNGKSLGLASPSVLASNNAIHSDLMKLLRKPLSNQKAQ